MSRRLILAKLADCFKGPPRFKLAPSPGGLKCRIRLFRAGDRPYCEAIYRLNEAAHFPSGFFEKFSGTLGAPAHVFIVAEVDGAVRGFAGLSMVPVLPHCVSWLAYGMVHPQFKRGGLGTALLLARLAALPESHVPCTILMTSVGGSNTFYERFGFRFFGVPAKRNVHGIDHYRVHFTRGDQIRCAQALQTVQVEREDIRLGFEAARTAAFAQAVPATA